MLTPSSYKLPPAALLSEKSFQSFSRPAPNTNSDVYECPISSVNDCHIHKNTHFGGTFWCSLWKLLVFINCTNKTGNSCLNTSWAQIYRVLTLQFSVFQWPPSSSVSWKSGVVLSDSFYLAILNALKNTDCLTELWVSKQAWRIQG